MTNKEKSIKNPTPQNQDLSAKRVQSMQNLTQQFGIKEDEVLNLRVLLADGISRSDPSKGKWRRGRIWA